MNKSVLDFIDGPNYGSDWRMDAQVYGILSKFAFIANKHEDELDEDELDAYTDAEQTYVIEGEIAKDSFRILIDVIKRWTGLDYKLDALDEKSTEENKREQVKKLVEQIVNIIEGE